MKVIVHLTKEEEAKALPILLRHSPGMVLPHRTYVLSEDALRALREAGVRFSEMSREAAAPSLPGRAGGCPPAPPQSRTSPIKAYGSSDYGLAL
jgi:hypothetical protein